MVSVSIYGFRQFTQVENHATVRATRFGDRRDGEFFVVRSDAVHEVSGAVLFRQNGEFAGIIDQSKRGKALAIPADVILRELQEITR